MANNKKRRRVPKDPSTLRIEAMMKARREIMKMYDPMCRLDKRLSRVVFDLQVAYPIMEVIRGEMERPTEYQVAVGVHEDVMMILERIEGFINGQLQDNK